MVIHILIVLLNDVHPNPGPQSGLCDLNICHTNIRSLKAESYFFFVKTELAGKHIISLNETWLSNLDNSEDDKISG